MKDISTVPRLFLFWDTWIQLPSGRYNRLEQESPNYKIRRSASNPSSSPDFSLLPFPKPMTVQYDAGTLLSRSILRDHTWPARSPALLSSQKTGTG